LATAGRVLFRMRRGWTLAKRHGHRGGRVLEVEGEGLPAGQEEHALSPGSEYSSGSQQTEAPAGENLPAKHPDEMSALHRPLTHNQSPPTAPAPRSSPRRHWPLPQPDECAAMHTRRGRGLRKAARGRRHRGWKNATICRIPPNVTQASIHTLPPMK